MSYIKSKAKGQPKALGPVMPPSRECHPSSILTSIWIREAWNNLVGNSWCVSVCVAVTQPFADRVTAVREPQVGSCIGSWGRTPRSAELWLDLPVLGDVVGDVVSFLPPVSPNHVYMNDGKHQQSIHLLPRVTLSLILSSCEYMIVTTFEPLI